jgi:hypothetical protein
MSGIEAKQDGENVVIAVQVGEKRVRMKVTREYAKALAAELLAAAGVATAARSPLDAILDANDSISRNRAQEFARNLTDILRGKRV